MGTRIGDPGDVLYEEPGPAQDPRLAESSWKEYNLLSLDGGGIRGYWSLLVLHKLMEFIAEAELACKPDAMDHSFAPQPYPENVSQLPLTEHETEDLKKVNGGDAKYRALSNTRRYLPCHYFDYIGGSSTGALIAIMLGRFRMTVPDCLKEYENLGGKTFGKPRFSSPLRYMVRGRTKYKGSRLQKVFEDVTARRSEEHEADDRITFPSRPGLCKVFVTTLSTEPPKKTHSTLYLIRSYDHTERTMSDPEREATPGPTRRTTRTDTGITCGSGIGGRQWRRRRKTINYGKAQGFQIWEVARAATAAPLFFEPLRIEIPGKDGYFLFTDGGFNYTNNPTMEGIDEIEGLSGRYSIGVVVSVGTARGNMPSSRWGLKSLVNIMAHNFTDPEVIHTNMEKESGRENFKYYRLNDPGRLDIPLDEWEPNHKLYTKNSGRRTLEKIEVAFAKWASKIETIQQFRECAEELVIRRRTRTLDRAKWERYATGAHFACRFAGCENNNFTNREEFERHLTGEHGVSGDKLNENVDAWRDCWRYQKAKAKEHQ